MNKLYAFLLGMKSITYLIFWYLAAVLISEEMYVIKPLLYFKPLFFQLVLWGGITIVISKLKEEVGEDIKRSEEKNSRKS